MSNELKYWHKGLPNPPVFITANDGGTIKYWLRGLPSAYIPTSTVSSLIKTVNALAKASVKTINGLAIASVKTWNGLT